MEEWASYNLTRVECKGEVEGLVDAAATAGYNLTRVENIK